MRGWQMSIISVTTFCFAYFVEKNSVAISLTLTDACNITV